MSRQESVKPRSRTDLRKSGGPKAGRKHRGSKEDHDHPLQPFTNVELHDDEDEQAEESDEEFVPVDFGANTPKVPDQEPHPKHSLDPGHAEGRKHSGSKHSSEGGSSRRGSGKSADSGHNKIRSKSGQGKTSVEQTEKHHKNSKDAVRKDFNRRKSHSSTIAIPTIAMSHHEIATVKHDEKQVHPDVKSTKTTTVVFVDDDEPIPAQPEKTCTKKQSARRSKRTRSKQTKLRHKLQKERRNRVAIERGEFVPEKKKTESKKKPGKVKCKPRIGGIVSILHPGSVTQLPKSDMALKTVGSQKDMKRRLSKVHWDQTTSTVSGTDSGQGRRTGRAKDRKPTKKDGKISGRSAGRTTVKRRTSVSSEERVIKERKLAVRQRLEQARAAVKAQAKEAAKEKETVHSEKKRKKFMKLLESSGLNDLIAEICIRMFDEFTFPAHPVQFFLNQFVKIGQLNKPPFSRIQIEILELLSKREILIQQNKILRNRLSLPSEQAKNEDVEVNEPLTPSPPPPSREFGEEFPGEMPEDFNDIEFHGEGVEEIRVESDLEEEVRAYVAEAKEKNADEIRKGSQQDKV